MWKRLKLINLQLNFNTISSYKNVSHVSTGNDNTIWIYNQDTSELEVYDYLNNKTRVKTLPIAENVLDITSNFNFCWLLTQDNLYCYNYFGSLVYKIPNTGYTKIKENNDNIILKRENALHFLKKNTTIIEALNLDELLINQFLLTNETLYIYDSNKLHSYQLKID